MAANWNPHDGSPVRGFSDLELPVVEIGAGAPAIERRPGIAMRGPEQAQMPDPSRSRGEVVVQFPDLGGYGGTHPERRALGVVEQARQEAARMVAEGRAAREAELATARSRGFDEGYAAGMAAADAETANLVRTTEAIATAVARERARYVAEAELEVARLAIAVAQRMVDGLVQVEPERVVDVCRGAIRKAYQRDQLSILANPADLEILRSAGPALARELGGIDHLEFVAERRVARGSVLVRTPAGEVDGTLAGKAERFAEMFAQLAEERRGRGDALPGDAFPEGA